MKKKRRGKLTGGLLFPQDNARVHSEQLSDPTATNCGFQLLAHMMLHPMTTTSSPKYKKGLRGKRVQSTDDEGAAIEQFSHKNLKQIKTILVQIMQSEVVLTSLKVS